MWPLRIVRIADRSMEPTIKDGGFVLAIFSFFRVRLGDVVLLRRPSSNVLIIKRVLRISDGKVWVEGDNSRESSDSRKFGWIDSKDIAGKVLMRF